MKPGSSTTLSRGALNADLDAALTQYQSPMRRLADQMIAKLPANVESDALIGVGVIGLAEEWSTAFACYEQSEFHS